MADLSAPAGNSLKNDLRKKVQGAKVLLVGAGGIGCEVLKNLVLSGFSDIHVIDLDTIDVSNLNRQFLFRKAHVGKSKAQVAKESVLGFNPSVNITSKHDSIMSNDYNVQYFKSFDLVLNALDNRAARNHVNRMCLSADVPLIESGSAGYLGQVTVIKRGLTECYECRPKPAQKTYPGCTIRNTPSEPVHCIVWAKHLYNQLFGEDDPDQDVSPDTEDPELTAEAGAAALTANNSVTADNKPASDNTNTADLQRVSTRAWAQENGYSAQKLFNKFFRDDIKYLLSMGTLWKSRRAPEPLEFNSLSSDVSSTNGEGTIRDQKMWSVQRCADIFRDCLSACRLELESQGSDGVLSWDKDDDVGMDFVASAANLRAHIFGISMLSRFDIKSIAGNIIPAIATTNAVVGGLQVVEALKVLSGQLDRCKSVFMCRQPNPRKKILNACMLDAPNPKCFVCSEKPEIVLSANVQTMTVRMLRDQVLKGELGMVAPDVEVDDGKGTILISSDEDETEANNDRPLSHFSIGDGARLKCDDFLQNYELVVSIAARAADQTYETEFDLVGDRSKLIAKDEEEADKDEPLTNTDASTTVDADDDVMIDDSEEPTAAQGGVTVDLVSGSRKRKRSGLLEEEEEDLLIIEDE